MSKYWSDLTKKLTPYVPGEQPKERKFIKLNTNENPYPPSPKVIEAIREGLNDRLKLYPDPDCEELRRAAAGYYGLNMEEVFTGNGSDEILAFSFMAFFNPGVPVIFPDITYTFYPVYCRLFNVGCRTVPLNENFEVEVEKFLIPNGGTLLANPNAPTGRYLEKRHIEKILTYNLERNEGSVVLIDEAYIDFGGDSAVDLIKKYPNLLVVQTLSKSRALAGLRVGFAFGQKELIEGLQRVKNSFNSYTLDALAIKGAVAAIEDEEYFRKMRSRIINTREAVAKALREMGFTVIDSKANFVFISHKTKKAGEIFSALREEGILVRYFRLPKIDNYLRVTIGSEEDMEYFIKTIGHIVKEF